MGGVWGVVLFLMFGEVLGEEEVGEGGGEGGEKMWRV